MNKSIVKFNLWSSFISCMIIVLPLFLNISCAGSITPSYTPPKKTAPDKILIHDNPAPGDYAVYQVESSGASYQLTAEVLSVDGDLINITTTFGSYPFPAVIDRQGNVIRYGNYNENWEIPAEPNTKFIDETVTITYKSKGYKAKPFFYPVRISTNAESALANSYANVDYFCTAYSHPGVKFKMLFTKGESVVISGNQRTQGALILQSALSSVQYITNPHMSLTQMAGTQGVTSFLQGYAERHMKKEFAEQGINIQGNVFSGDFKISMTSSYTITLIRDGNKNRSR